MNMVGRRDRVKEYRRERCISVSAPHEDKITLHLDNDVRDVPLNGSACGDVVDIARRLSRFPACMTWRALGVEP